MIRLLRTVIPQACPAFTLFINFTNRNHKNKRGILNEHPQQVKLNWGERRSKDKNQKQLMQQQHHKYQKSQKGNKQNKHFQRISSDITTLIDSSFIEAIEAKFTIGTKLSLREEWERICKIGNHFEQNIALFQLMHNLFPVLMDLKVTMSKQLLHSLMQNYFCSQTLMNRYMNSRRDPQIVSFLTQNLAQIEQYFNNATIKQQLGFYSFFKDLSFRRIGQDFRSLVYSFNFLYKKLQDELQKIDFSEELGQQVMNMFSRIIKDYPLNHSDEHLLKIIISQVPFFPPDSLLHFLQNHASLLQKAEPAMVLSIIQAIKLQGFDLVKADEFIHFISIFCTLNNFHPEMATEIEGLLELLLLRLLQDRSKYPRNFIFQILEEISKQVELKPASPEAVELFSFLKAQIETLAFLPNQSIRRQLNILFQILSVLINNKFLIRNSFTGELKSLESALQRVVIRRKQLSKSYLWELFRGNGKKKTVLDVRLMLDLSLKKQASFIQEILSLKEIELCKSLMVILVQPQRQPLLSLKRILPEYDYQQILLDLNRCLLEHDSFPIIQEVFWQVIKRPKFSQLAIDLVESLSRVGREEMALRALFLGCLRLIYERGSLRRLVESLTIVLDYIINTLKKTELLLAQPQFYFILTNMLSQIKLLSRVNEIKINIFRMVDFILGSNMPLFNDIIEPFIRNLKLYPEDFELLRPNLSIQSLETNLARFKLSHIIPFDQISRISNKIQTEKIKVSQKEKVKLMKQKLSSWLPEQINSTTLIAFFMDEFVLERIAGNQQTIHQIIQNASLNELAFYVYNFNNSSKVLESQLFADVWKLFVSRLTDEDIPQILSIHLLGKYSHLDNSLYLPFFFKVLEYYAANPACYSSYMHGTLFINIRLHFRSVTQYSHPVHAFVMAFRKYLAQYWHYVTPSHRLQSLNHIIQLGYGLNQAEINEIRSQLQEKDFGFFIYVLSESVIPDKIQDQLKLYLREHAIRNIIQPPQIQHYVTLKYPELKKQLIVKGGSIPSILKEVNLRQLAALKRIYKRYGELQLVRKLNYLTNSRHLIAFYPSDNKPFLFFLQKLYAIDPATSHLQHHFFDLNQMGKPFELFAKIEGLGIVSALKKEQSQEDQRAETAEDTPELKLAKAVAKINKQQLQNSPDETPQ